jgi:hydrogenase maturation protease
MSLRTKLMSKTQYLVIGYGNTLRGDDGAGYAVAEAVEAWNLPQVRSLPLHQLTVDLAADISEVDVVIFVDAAMPSELNNTASEIEIRSITSAVNPADLGHAVTPQALLAIAQSIYQSTPNAYWVLIPAENFDFSEEVSTTTQTSMQVALDRIKDIVSQSVDVDKSASKLKLPTHP